MTIDEAIEELEAICLLRKRELVPSSLDAIQLGIEALKWVKAQKDMDIIGLYNRLPGETGE